MSAPGAGREHDGARTDPGGAIAEGDGGAGRGAVVDVGETATGDGPAGVASLIRLADGRRNLRTGDGSLAGVPDPQTRP